MQWIHTWLRYVVDCVRLRNEALQLAAQSGDVGAIKVLIQMNVDINAKDEE